MEEIGQIHIDKKELYRLNRRLKYHASDKSYLSLKRKELYIINKDEINRIKREKRKINPTQLNETSKKYLKDNPNKALLYRIRSNAIRRNQDCNIEIEDILIPKYCPYLNIELTNISDSGQLQTNISVDRIDNTKGYIKGNIQIISRLANTMKSNASIEQLITFAKSVLIIHNK